MEFLLAGDKRIDNVLNRNDLLCFALVWCEMMSCDLLCAARDEFNGFALHCNCSYNCDETHNNAMQHDAVQTTEQSNAMQRSAHATRRTAMQTNTQQTNTNMTLSGQQAIPAPEMHPASRPPKGIRAPVRTPWAEAGLGTP